MFTFNVGRLGTSKSLILFACTHQSQLINIFLQFSYQLREKSEQFQQFQASLCKAQLATVVLDKVRDILHDALTVFLAAGHTGAVMGDRYIRLVF